MTLFADAAAATAVLITLALGSPPAAASDPICPNPVTDAEVAICDDPYLLGLDMQINIVMGRFIDANGGELPLGVEMEYGHHTIGREACGGNFRCLESELRSHLDRINAHYLEGPGAWLASGRSVPFQTFDNQTSAGGEWFDSKVPSNFGWSQALCRMRCAVEDRCFAVAYTALRLMHGKYGYCVMKERITLPMPPYDGVTMMRQDR